MEKEKMLERKSAMPIWVWIVGAVVVIGLIFIGYRMIRIQHHLKTANTKIERKLDQATSEIGQLKNNLDTAQSQLKDKASNLETMQSELETAKRLFEKG
jgi:peptidoglycan hydrolase CwlO-like protein